MKELTIEQKAKRYEEAIEIAKEINNEQCAQPFNVMTRVFPELRESEDERIRNKLLKIFREAQPTDNWGGLSTKDIIAWLEKQGEQKPIDKPEPKFKVKYAGSEYNVFEIKDIADVIFYGIEDEPNHIDYVQAENCEIVSGYGVKEKGSPYPTKSAMFSEQSLSWSEEDEELYNDLSDTYFYNDEDYPEDTYKHMLKKVLDWMNKRAKYLRPQKQEWSEEDEEISKAIIDKIAGSTLSVDLQKAICWVRNIKNRV